MLVEKINKLDSETLEVKRVAAKKFARALKVVLDLREQLENMRNHNKRGHVFLFTVTEFEIHKEEIAKAEAVAQEFFNKIV